MKKILTNDGTETLFNEYFQEAYHSIKAGAYTESLNKFVYPCKIDELARQKNEIWILDIGFGLGYNVALAIYVIKQINTKCNINILSVDIDTKVLEKIKLINIHQELQDIYTTILKGVYSKKKIGKNIYSTYSLNTQKINLNIVFEDGRKIIKDLVEDGYLFDAVFYDAFSPKVNAEMWTLDIFKLVYKVMSDEAILATYSASLSVRKALMEAGFKIGLVEPVGRKSYSTVASKSGNIPPLNEKELNRIRTSTFAVPMRDPELKDDRNTILNKWKTEVEKNLTSKSL